MSALNTGLRESSHSNGNGYSRFVNECDPDRYLDVLDTDNGDLLKMESNIFNKNKNKIKFKNYNKIKILIHQMENTYEI